jgi:hypothetical protein
LAFDDKIITPHPKGTDFQIADDRQRWQAAEWIAKIEAGGGTELGAALRAALQPFATFGMPEGRDAVVVLITDGQVAGEDSVLRTIEALHLPRMPRIFTLGIDRSVNASLLTRLADLGGGAFELIESEQRLDQVLERVHQQIAPPILTDVTIEPLEGEIVKTTFTPENNRHVFADKPLTILGRCGADPKSLRFRVTARDASGGTWRQEITAERTNSPMLLPLWGRSRVRELEDQYARSSSSSNQKLQTQIVAISLESHILSRFTAYVAVDRAEVVNKGGVQEQIVQPVEQPGGWSIPVAAAPIMREAMMPASAGAGAKYRSRSQEPTRAKKSRGFFGFFRGTPDEVDEPMDGMRNDILGAAVPPPATDGGDDFDDSLLQEFTDTAIDFTDTASAFMEVARAPRGPAARRSSTPIEPIPLEIIELIPESVARENNLLPVAEKDDILVVRMSDPNDLDTIEKLRFILNRPIEAVRGKPDEIFDSIDHHYGQIPADSANVLQEFSDKAISDSTLSRLSLAEAIDENASPIVRMVTLMFQEALQFGASHIVVQPEATQVAISFLIGDELRRRDCPPLRLHSALISRLRIDAKFAPRPHTLELGVIKRTMGTIDVNIHVVFIPTPQGMAVVMRLVTQAAAAARPNWPALLATWLEQVAQLDGAKAPAIYATLCGDSVS